MNNILQYAVFMFGIITYAREIGIFLFEKFGLLFYQIKKCFNALS